MSAACGVTTLKRKSSDNAVTPACWQAGSELIHACPRSHHSLSRLNGDRMDAKEHFLQARARQEKATEAARLALTSDIHLFQHRIELLDANIRQWLSGISDAEVENHSESLHDDTAKTTYQIGHIVVKVGAASLEFAPKALYHQRDAGSVVVTMPRKADGKTYNLFMRAAGKESGFWWLKLAGTADLLKFTSTEFFDMLEKSLPDPS